MTLQPSMWDHKAVTVPNVQGILHVLVRTGHIARQHGPHLWHGPLRSPSSPKRRSRSAKVVRCNHRAANRCSAVPRQNSPCARATLRVQYNTAQYSLVQYRSHCQTITTSQATQQKLRAPQASTYPSSTATAVSCIVQPLPCFAKPCSELLLSKAPTAAVGVTVLLLLCPLLPLSSSTAGGSNARTAASN